MNRNETDEQRKIRVLSDEVDRLRSMVEQHRTIAPPPAGVPDAVQFALAVMERLQVARTQTHQRTQYGTEVTMDPVELGAEELMALGSACQLLSAWFDQQNPKFNKNC